MCAVVRNTGRGGSRAERILKAETKAKKAYASLLRRVATTRQQPAACCSKSCMDYLTTDEQIQLCLIREFETKGDATARTSWLRQHVRDSACIDAGVQRLGRASHRIRGHLYCAEAFRRIYGLGGDTYANMRSQVASGLHIAHEVQPVKRTHCENLSNNILRTYQDRMAGLRLRNSATNR